MDGVWKDHVPSIAHSAPDLWAKRYAKAPAGARRVHVHTIYNGVNVADLSGLAKRELNFQTV